MLGKVAENILDIYTRYLLGTWHSGVFNLGSLTGLISMSGLLLCAIIMLIKRGCKIREKCDKFAEV